jgi:hypothetical protein
LAHTVNGEIPFSGDSLEISIIVCDSGAGISPENQKKLFVPFAQIRPHDLQGGSGSGLGLVLAKEIITMHGGQLLMESEEGRGSSFGFCIVLPVSSVRREERTAAVSPLPDFHTPRSHGGADGVLGQQVLLRHGPRGCVISERKRSSVGIVINEREDLKSNAPSKISIGGGLCSESMIVSNDDVGAPSGSSSGGIVSEASSKAKKKTFLLVDGMYIYSTTVMEWITVLYD